MVMFGNKKGIVSAKASSSPAERAAKGIETALEKGELEAHEDISVVDERLRHSQTTEKLVETVLPEEQTKPVENETQRGLRLLVVSSDTSFFSEDSPRRHAFLSLAGYFDQLHIIVLSKKKQDFPETKRIADNVWLYASNSGSALGSVFGAHRIARAQLKLATGFYADSVLATDARVAGFASYIIARRYKRSLQLQLAEDPFDKTEDQGGFFARMTSRFVVRRADCIVVRAEEVRRPLVKRYPHIADNITVLPPFHDITYFRDARPDINIREKYPQFKFVILIASRLESEDRANFALDICIPFLQQYPTLGVFIVGNGSQRGVLKKRVTESGLSKRIIFVSGNDNLVSYMKSAHLLLNVMADEDHDATVASAAAAGLPVLTAHGGIADLLFKDGVSAFICEGDNVGCFQSKIGEFLSDNQLRTTFEINARNQVFANQPQDPGVYWQTFVNILESCLTREDANHASE